MKTPSLMMVLCAGLFVLSGCTNKGDGLAGDQNLASSCPSGGCADMTPQQAQLSITGPGQSRIYAPVPAAGPLADGSLIDAIELGGTCYASTYQTNRITISVSIASGGVTTGIAAGNITSTRGIDGTLSCYQGRYGFSMNGAAFPLNSIATVTVNIVGIDTTGTTYTNPAGGQYVVQIYRTSQ